MSARTFTRLTRIDRGKAAAQLAVLYRLVQGSPLLAEDTRGSLLAQFLDLAETIGVDWSVLAKPMTLDEMDAAFGRHARAYAGPSEPGGAQ
jgi:hypothetical protein